MLRTTLYPLGLEGETRLNQNITLNLEAYLDYHFYNFIGLLANAGSTNFFVPSIFAEVRNYFSPQKRKEKGKPWRFNTGPFYGVRYGYAFSPLIGGYQSYTPPNQSAVTTAIVGGYNYVNQGRIKFCFSISGGIGITNQLDERPYPTGVWHATLGIALVNDTK